LNIKQMQAQAKALAPVIREYVQELMADQEKRLAVEHNDALVKVAEDFNEKLESLREGIPEPIDKEGMIAEISCMIPSDGIDGKDGVDGNDGADGKDGESVSIEDIQPLLDEAVRSIEAPVDGKDGSDGSDGKDGIDGKDGESVTIDQIQPLLDEAVKNIEAPVDGKDGKDGVDGKDGEHGKDALCIEILPAVDMEKDYPRGTYAMHNGGLIRSHQQTHGENGWETVWNGIADINVSMSHSREVTITHTMTNGIIKDQSFAIPTMVYRGIFKEGDSYTQGDVVTFGGSLWHSDMATDAKPGTKDSGWTLAAKKGRDGRNGGS